METDNRQTGKQINKQTGKQGTYWTGGPVDDHGGLVLTGQVAEGDVGDLVDHMFPQRVV